MGRPKGSVNKITKRASEIAEEMGVNPLEVLLLFAKGDWKALGYDSATRVTQDGDNVKYEYHVEPSVRMKAAESACRYIFPTQKAVELSGPEDGNGIKIIIEDFSGGK